MKTESERKVEVKIDLTFDDLCSVTYALRELANRRQEQSIDLRCDAYRAEAESMRSLAERFTASFGNARAALKLAGKEGE